MVLFYTSIMEAAAIPFGISGLAVMYFARGIDRWPRRLCIAIMCSSVAAAVLNLLGNAAFYYHASLPLCWAVIIAENLIVPIPSLLITAYLLYCSGEDWRSSALMHIQGALTCILILAEIVGYFTGEHSITPEYRVSFGRLSVYYWVLMAAMTVIFLMAIIRRWKKLTTPQRIIFLVSFISPSYIQCVLLTLIILADLIHSYTEQMEETARQKTQIAVLKMRPHFIHNTLMSIYYLCAKDPEKAQNVIKDFSRYLQNNFTAIAEESTVPFSKELEHTQAYLAVEKARYEGRLFVEFDTPNTFFRIPPLTLQPIVENAIKHGLDPDLEPLYVSVVTEDADDGVRIIVEDTGPGYAPSDDRPHFALDNIRERLETMCGGTLQIEKRDAGGTKVTLFVPWKDVKK